MSVTFRSTYKDLQRIYFGDGNVESLESSIQYTYQEAGLYEVKLTGNCDNAGPNVGCIEPDIDSVTVCVGQSACSSQIEEDPYTQTLDAPLPQLPDTQSAQYDIWLLTTKNNLTFIDTPSATYTQSNLLQIVTVTT